MVNEGGISQATLLHLRFHNKWLSLGKPKQITPSVRAAQDALKLWFDISAAALPTRSSPCAGQGTRLPHTHPPQELIWLKNNLAESSKANQTFGGQVPILSTAV